MAVRDPGGTLPPIFTFRENRKINIILMLSIIAELHSTVVRVVSVADGLDTSVNVTTSVGEQTHDRSRT
jgi:hypothetical protein